MKNDNRNLFFSYWQAGYEGADHINNMGQPLSMNELTRHNEYAYHDYSLLKKLDIKTVRESIGWRLVDRNGQFDFSIIESRARAANELGIQVIWTLCHYGIPEDINIFTPTFVDRFAAYCKNLVKFLKSYSDTPSIYSPINEISFLCWAINNGYFACKNLENNTSNELKRQLIRAALKGCEAIWQIDSSARIIHSDPLIHVIAPFDSKHLVDSALIQRQAQFDSWDMLCGTKDPELGGKPYFLDLIGVNYYHSNQWEMEGDPLWWHLEHPRRIPLSKLLIEIFERYQRPLLLTETSHVGSGRGAWIREVAQQAILAQQKNVDFHGICLYPIIDRPDWDNPLHWHKSGLWEINIQEDNSKHYDRVISEPYLTGFYDAQRLTKHFLQNFHQFNSNSQLKGSCMTTIIVFSHLRWDFVYQRPQHLLTRLAEHYKIIFIEEPIWSSTNDNYIQQSLPVPGVTVLKPFTISSGQGFDDEQLPYLRELISQLKLTDEAHLAWFYTPMALPLLNDLNPMLVIYDCMDELAAFKNSPTEIIQRENELFNVTDLVFTGGPSLFRAKQKRHPNVHCFPSSVDSVHFEQARDRNNNHPLHDHIPYPRLGYYGVIDERMDFELIACIADSHPEWQIILVGPVIKINPELLPRHSNIHYFGQQPYKALPQFLAGWDVCLLPFALNESTQFISPTKTLEYMAAELPIVSTAINDVSELYGEEVAITLSTSDFIEACEEALTQPLSEFRRNTDKTRKIIEDSSWNKTAEKMYELIEFANNNKNSSLFNSLDFKSESVKISNLFESEVRKNIIIGAGPTGLSAAYHLDEDTLVIEKNSTVGGWCRSINDKGFTFDYAGHIMFSNDQYVQELYKILLGDNVHWQNREAWIFSKGVHTRYPFQGALYGLPTDVIRECIVGAIEASYGIEKKLKNDTLSNNCLFIDKMDDTKDCCADGVVAFTNNTIPHNDQKASKAENFEDFIHKIWGAGIAKHFAIPYNTKLWKVPLSEMETSWLGDRVPLPNLEEIIEGALEPVARPMGPNARFGYPLKGGFQALMSGFLPFIKGSVKTNTEVIQVSPEKRFVRLNNGRQIQYDNIISTMPLPQLINCIGSEAPPFIHNSAANLRHVSVCCVNLGIGRENITDKHWIYYPEETIFHRIFVQGNASPHCNPVGGFGLTCEISYSTTHPLLHKGQELIDKCVNDCIKVGLLTSDDTIITANIVDMPYAYVVYDHSRANNIRLIREWLMDKGIILAGRYSEWEYYNSDHAFIAGKKAADIIIEQTQKEKIGINLSL
ncbi:FAD-dependent oxidoreductase [Nitrosomonas supralitoralis]|uniref:Amine oxidase n=1 Tax=Nitrosomonas supralitoralis TaxID=2116706 RepID=A0A2P7NRC0_9PROT|nr:FAD-dependent oxidoreductase [Nitrosomonas supralitoralis]PSJ16004.1 amine oxidase [Nitrosomonas supralitoralis]